MKKIISLFAAVAFATMALAAPAMATTDHSDHDGREISGKPVTVCHATSSARNPYVKLTNVPVVQFFGQNGHASHEGDIWAAFSYIKRTGADTWETVNVPSQGDTSLLAFDDCQKPKVDTPVAKPTPVFSDACGTKNDTFAVAPGEGYTVGDVTTDGLTKTIVVTLNEGFVWAGGSHDALTFSHTFTNEDCGLPDTGSKAQHNTIAGASALAFVALLGGGLMFTRRRRTN